VTLKGQGRDRDIFEAQYLNNRATVRDTWSVHIDGLFILTTDRKAHLGNPVVIWPMTSRDPKCQSRDPNTFEAEYLKNCAR